MIFKYHRQFDLGDPVLGMKNFEARQSQLKLAYGFTCQCDLCKEEKITNDNEKYEKFEMLLQKIQLMEKNHQLHMQKFNQSRPPPYKTYHELIKNIKIAVSCFREMYELTQISKRPSRFMPYYHEIIIKVIVNGFDTGFIGYVNAKMIPQMYFGDKSDVSNMEYFKDECQNFSKIGLQMAENMCGSYSILTKKWKERNNFEQWMAQEVEEDEKLWSNSTFY